MNKRLWNTMEISNLPPKLIYDLIDHTYDLVVAKLPKKLKDQFKFLTWVWPKVWYTECKEKVRFEMENLKEYLDISKNLHEKIILLFAFPADLINFFQFLTLIYFFMKVFGNLLCRFLAKFSQTNELVFLKPVFELNKNLSKL